MKRLLLKLQSWSIESINFRHCEQSEAIQVFDLRGNSGLLHSVRNDGLFKRGSVLFLGIMLLSSACSNESNHEAERKLETNSAVSISIKSSAEIFPAFDVNITDYVSRCVDGQALKLSINASPQTMVSVANSGFKFGSFETSIFRSAGQSFKIEVRVPAAASRSYYVRCLPSDFQAWKVDSKGPTQSEWYQVTLRTTAPNAKPYPAIFDNNGVPVWWASEAKDSVFAELLPNGNFAWLSKGSTIKEMRLDGSVVRETHTSHPLDLHDMLLLPNGNYIVATSPVLNQVDLTTWGLSNNESIVNHLIEEIDEQGNVVWAWDAREHLDVSETDPLWRSTLWEGTNDPYHLNSIEPTESGLILSLRHLNAIVKIDKTTGNIIWKLGGSHSNESLAVINDPFSETQVLGGQHDVRLLDDGTLSLHENGSKLGRPPRVLRYAIDEGGKTATLLDEWRAPDTMTSSCCGSARRLPGGNWVVGWGGTSTAEEMSPIGSRLFSMEFTSGNYVYRGIPIPYGQLDRDALRAAMDAHYPVRE